MLQYIQLKQQEKIANGSLNKRYKDERVIEGRKLAKQCSRIRRREDSLAEKKYFCHGARAEKTGLLKEGVEDPQKPVW